MRLSENRSKHKAQLSDGVFCSILFYKIHSYFTHEFIIVHHPTSSLVLLVRGSYTSLTLLLHLSYLITAIITAVAAFSDLGNTRRTTRDVFSEGTFFRIAVRPGLGCNVIISPIDGNVNRRLDS